MGYNKQNFIKGSILTAEQMTKIDNAIYELSNQKTDWDIDNSEEAGFIKNRPFYVEEMTIPEQAWQGDNVDYTISGYGFKRMYPEKIAEELFIDGTLNIKNPNGEVKENIPIVGVAKTLSEYEMLITSNLIDKDIFAFWTIGKAINLTSNWIVLCVYEVSEEALYPLAVFLDAHALNSSNEKGFYFVKIDNVPFLTQVNFENIVISQKYSNFFNSLNNKITVVNINGESDIASLDFSKFKAGEIVLITSQQVEF